MTQQLSSALTESIISNLKKGLNILLFGIVGFLFSFCSVLTAQKVSDSVSGSSVVAVMNGATIYSGDEGFNNQVLAKKILIQGNSALTTQIENNQTTVLVHTSKSVEASASLAIVVEKEKQQKIFAKIIKRIEQNKKVYVFHINPSSAGDVHFNQTCHLNDFSVANCSSNNDHKKMDILSSNDFIKIRFSPLSTKKINFYESDRFYYRYSENFSVRPPPVS